MTKVTSSAITAKMATVAQTAVHQTFGGTTTKPSRIRNNQGNLNSKGAI
jgi:hypothetical protein